MSKVVDRLVRMTLNLSAKDGNLCAAVDSERRARFWFHDESQFEYYGAFELSTQVESLVRTMDLGRREGIRQAYAAEGREPVRVTDSHWDAAHRRFYEALAKTEPLGESATGLIILAANPDLSDCRADINDRALRDTDAATFLRELTGAYHNLLADRRRQRAELLKRHFGT